MSEFQTVKRRGHSQNANTKYPEQYQQLVEMGFDAASVTRALETSNGEMEAATALLIGEDRSSKNDTEEKVVSSTKDKKSVAATVVSTTAAASVAASADSKAKGARQSAGLATVSGQAVKDIKETHQKMIATYKVQKCKEAGSHDRKMCMHYHSLSDRRRNPFEVLYSCYECPNTVDGGECPDGDSCMNSHTMLERMFHPELYKISVCQRQLTGNKCDRAMLCAFAHNDADLRISPSHLTTKYAMQEEAKTTPVPVNQSAMLDHIRVNLVKLIKEHGNEGVIAADLPKHYQGRFHESLDLIDEAGKKYKLKDLIGSHNNIHIVMGSNPKFIFGDPSLAVASSETTSSTTTSSSTATVSPTAGSKDGAVAATSVKDRVVELIKAAGAEGILATDMPKKYQDHYSEKLDKDWTVGLNTVAGMVLTQTKQYTKYTFNAITAGIKDTAAIATKDVKATPVSATANAPGAKTAAVPASAPVSTSSSTPAAPKWGSNAGKSFASILAANGSAAGAPPSLNATSESTTESSKPSTPAVASTPVVVETTAVAAAAAVTPTPETKASASTTTTKPISKTDKVAEKTIRVPPRADSKSSTTSSIQDATSSQTVDQESSSDDAPASVTATSDSVLGHSQLQNTSSPSTSIGIHLGSSPAPVSRTSSDMNASLPKPLFGHLDGLNHDQFSLSGLGGNGSSSLLDLTGTSLTGILTSSFDLPMDDNMDLGSTAVMPPGLSKTIGKPSNVPGNSSLSSILGQSLGSNTGLVGMSLTSSSRDTPERNTSTGSNAMSLVNTSNLTPSERIAYLERELASKAQEVDARNAEVSNLRARLNEVENGQLMHDERLRSNMLEKDMELLSKHQEIAKYEEEIRKMREEKLVDLDQSFVYFSKIEEVMNSMKCKEEAFSDKVKPEDVQELFQFKKLIRNYVANVKVQLKNKFDSAVAQSQSQLMRNNSNAGQGKDSSVDSVSFGLSLSAGPPPGGLTATSTSVSGNNATSPSTSNNVFGVLSGNSNAVANSTGSNATSRFASSFDHSVPLHHLSHSHHGLGNVVDAFSASSVLFPSSNSSQDLNVSNNSVNTSAKQCGLPGCLKEGLYTCAGCRKISYCGEIHQRNHWGQHSLICSFQR